MKPHIYGSCAFDECPACERIAEYGRDYDDADPYGWGADRLAEEYERRVLDGGWA